VAWPLCESGAAGSYQTASTSMMRRRSAVEGCNFPPRCRKASRFVAFHWILAYENGGESQGDPMACAALLQTGRLQEKDLQQDLAAGRLWA